MRQKPLWLAAFFLALFFLSLWLRRPPLPPCLSYVEGSPVVSVGNDLKWYGMDGSLLRVEKLPFVAQRLFSFDGALAVVPEGSRSVALRSFQGSWKTFDPPAETRGEGVWAAGKNRWFYLQIRPAKVWTRAVTESLWRSFWAEGEELENPMDIAVVDSGIVLLNRDPVEAVRFDEDGRAGEHFDLERRRLWPLMRLVFEGPLDLVRPRRCETPRRVWSGEDGRLAVLFSTETDDTRRLVLLRPERDGTLTIKEGLLALRSEGLKQRPRLADVVFLPGGKSVLTSDRGGLWLHDANLSFLREWEKLPPLAPRWERRTKVWAPWILLGLSLLALLAAVWPKTSFLEGSRSIPRRVYGVGFASLLLPGLGQILQRRWLWALFWMIWALGWGVGVQSLTMRLKAGGLVTPATYFESLLVLSFAWVGSIAQACVEEWRATARKR